MRSLNRALVIGGAGFYGTWLVAELVAQGVETTVLDPRGGRELPARADVVLGTSDGVDLGELLAEHAPDAIFQLAGTGLVPASLTDPIRDLLLNTRTTVAILEAARLAESPPLVCFVSSAAVYGEQRHAVMNENHPLAPMSPYGISKLAAEQYVRLYADLYGTPTLSVRPFSLYGPRQRKLVIYDLLVRLVAGENPLTVAAPADLSRDFVWVGDAAAALVTIARQAPGRGEPYNLASGTGTTLDAIVEHLADCSGVTPEIGFDSTVRAGNPLHWIGDSHLAQSLGASFDTPLEVGLEETVRWYLDSDPSPARPQVAVERGTG